MFTIYYSDVTGVPSNCSYPHKKQVIDEESLKEAISHDYVCAEYKNSYRSGDNFIGSNCLPVDCDNALSNTVADDSADVATPVISETEIETVPLLFKMFHVKHYYGRIKL